MKSSAFTLLVGFASISSASVAAVLTTALPELHTTVDAIGFLRLYFVLVAVAPSYHCNGRWKK